MVHRKYGLPETTVQVAKVLKLLLMMKERIQEGKCLDEFETADAVEGMILNSVQ